MTVKISLATPTKVEKFVLEPYKVKCQDNDNERVYVAFLENTVLDAKNGLTNLYLILNEKNEIIGVFALSAASIKFEELNKENKSDWKLYEDLTEYPAVRLDLFLILPSYRGKGFGSKALDKLVAYLDAKRTSLMGYRYLITLSTSEVFDQLLLTKSFKPFFIEDVEEFRQNGFYRDTPEDTVKILRMKLKKTGIWFYLDFGGL